jgi:hypothetical protein
MPHKDEPHSRALHSASQPALSMHCALKLQLLSAGHVPQEPPQPSGPQALPPQLGVQLCGSMHCPSALHTLPDGQLPHPLPHCTTLHGSMPVPGAMHAWMGMRPKRLSTPQTLPKMPQSTWSTKSNAQ